MAMTHLTEVADRIDRSYSPRGGREERELDDLLKNSAATGPFLVFVVQDNASGRLLLQPQPPR